MSRFFPFLVAIIFAVNIAGQTSSSSQAAASSTASTPTSTPLTAVSNAAAATTSANRNDEKPLVKIGKVPVPPEKAKAIRIPKTGLNSITIDGRIDEEIWKNAAVFKDFYQTGPGDNIAPSKPTEVYMLYDEKNLYIAFKCWDDKDKIRASVAKRDSIFGEDNVRMWLDTYNDQRRAYVLGFNPFGIQQDGIYTEGQGADFTVDIVMESKGVIEEWGWSVEAKIPFKSLRYAAGKGKMWGFNAARNIDRFNDEFDQWLPDDRNTSGFLVKHGKITGLDEIKYEHTVEVIPSVTLSQSSVRKRTIFPDQFGQLGPYDAIFNPIGVQDVGKFIHDPVKQDIGVNLKYTISPNTTLDAAINPDYAEIEADAPVVTANQRFPIFFAEKRPFFLEGKDIFDSPLSLFYSRTIVDPDFAVKLSGKSGKTTYGFLTASDNAPGNFSQDERGIFNTCLGQREVDPSHPCPLEEFVDKNALFGVLRVKRDVGKENNVGFFSTARIFPQNRNFTAGLDGKFKLDPRTVMTFQVAGTHSQKYFYDPEKDEVRYRAGNGLGYYWSLDYTTDLHGWYAEAIGRTRDYRTDAGFTKRTDSNSFFFANRFSTKSKPKAAIIRANFNQFARYGLDFEGRMQQWLGGGNANLTMQGNLFLYFEAGVSGEKIYEDEFGPKRNLALNTPGGFIGGPSRYATQPYLSFNFNKTVSKKLSLYGFVGSIINSMDYDFGGGYKFPRASRAFVSYLNSPAYTSYIDQLYASQADPGAFPHPGRAPRPPQQDPGPGFQFDVNVGGEYKPIDPFRISIDYTKSRLTRNDTGVVAYDTDIFTIRSTYQFTRFTFVRARWDYDTMRSHAAGQFLFGWNPNPGTAFYVGYNDDFNYSGYNPFTGQFEPGFNRNSRTFFIRASYLFRKSF